LTLPAYLWLNNNHLRNFPSDNLSQDKSCKEIINEQDKEKFKYDFLKMKRIWNYIFILWKFLPMSKLLCNVLKIRGGHLPQMPCLVARLPCCIIKVCYTALTNVTSHDYVIYINGPWKY